MCLFQTMRYFDFTAFRSIWRCFNYIAACEHGRSRVTECNRSKI